MNLKGYSVEVTNLLVLKKGISLDILSTDKIMNLLVYTSNELFHSEKFQWVFFSYDLYGSKLVMSSRV